MLYIQHHFCYCIHLQRYELGRNSTTSAFQHPILPLWASTKSSATGQPVLNKQQQKRMVNSFTMLGEKASPREGPLAVEEIVLGDGKGAPVALEEIVLGDGKGAPVALLPSQSASRVKLLY